MRRLLIAATLPFVVAACTSVSPQPAPQARGTVIIEGDSITSQFLANGGAEDFPGYEFHAGPGWSMNMCIRWSGGTCVNPDDNVRTKIAAGEAATIVWALGTNDASLNPFSGGWNENDEEVWTDALLATPPDACAVVIKPWLLPGPEVNAEYLAEIDEARAWMATAVELLDDQLHTVDWRPYAEQPGVIADDGIHLSHGPEGRADLTPEARAARRQVIAEAVSLCTGEGTS